MGRIDLAEATVRPHVQPSDQPTSDRIAGTDVAAAS
jgi:hypothetical protein